MKTTNNFNFEKPREMCCDQQIAFEELYEARLRIQFFIETGKLNDLTDGQARQCRIRLGAVNRLLKEVEDTVCK